MSSALLLAQQAGASTGLARYTPRVVLHARGNTAGDYARPPRGVILHGSRSGLRQPLDREFYGTVGYAGQERHGLGWTATIGEDMIALHMTPAYWGWNARKASSLYLAVEFAQPTVNDPITDGQVRAFCWAFRSIWQVYWPSLPLVFPTHAELDVDGVTGKLDGKSDVFPYGDARADELRARIARRLAEPIRYI